MAPLFTIGGAMGQVFGALAAAIVPAAAIDLKVAGLVGMAAMFAGASRAFLACTVFAFEATMQPFSLLPLLGGCAASYLAATLMMKNSLMTEKIVRRGVATTHEYTADLLAQVTGPRRGHQKSRHAVGNANGRRSAKLVRIGQARIRAIRGFPF